MKALLAALMIFVASAVATNPGLKEYGAFAARRSGIRVDAPPDKPFAQAVESFTALAQAGMILSVTKRTNLGVMSVYDSGRVVTVGAFGKFFVIDGSFPSPPPPSTGKM